MSNIPLNYTLEEVIEYVPGYEDLFDRVEIYKERIEKEAQKEAAIHFLDEVIAINENLLDEVIELITKTKSKKDLLEAVTLAFEDSESVIEAAHQIGDIEYRYRI
jgi:PDZ domain-containing secreted protein